MSKLAKKIAQVRERLDNSLVASLEAACEKVLQFLVQEEEKLDQHRERAMKLAEYQVSTFMLVWFCEETRATIARFR